MAFRWRADDGPILVGCWIHSLTNKIKLDPLLKNSGFAHGLCLCLMSKFIGSLMYLCILHQFNSKHFVPAFV